MRPPVPYFGGKMRLAADMARLMPPHGHYVEPFAGSLAVLLAKPRVPHETVNDIDGDLMTFWRVLRDQPDDLARACALTPHSRAEHAASQTPAPGPLPDLERARRVFVELTQGRAALRTRTGWRHYQDPGGTSCGMPGYLDGYARRIHPAAERLAGVSLECRPALDLVAAYGRHPDVLLYLDPPYLPATRSDGSYTHELSAADHGDLIDACLAARSAVMLSGYPSPLYDDALRGWDRVEIATNTGQGGTWSARTEVVWCNRPMSRQAELDLAGAS
jgi:DNA adenine methylase